MRPGKGGTESTVGTLYEVRLPPSLVEDLSNEAHILHIPLNEYIQRILTNRPRL
jgi:predicted HicB family RNase H-like nuclease